MEFTVNSKEFANAVSLCAGVAAKKSINPILQNVYLSTEGAKKGLIVGATDNEIALRLAVSANTKTKGSITVRASLLSDVVRELPDGELKVTLQDRGRIELVCGGATMRLVGVPADEYPGLSGTALEPKGKATPRDFVEMVGKVLYATSPDETRLAMSGVCFDYNAKESTLRFAATDGHRLSTITRKATGCSLKSKVVVSKRALLEAKKLLSPESEIPFGLDVIDGFLIVETGTAKLAAKLVDAEFPPYEGVIPAGATATAVINRQEFVSALRRAALLTPEKTKYSRMTFGDNTLTVSSLAPDVGEATETLPVTFKGTGFSVGFNAQYLLEFAESLGSATESVLLELNGAAGPCKLCCETDSAYFGVLMPMRLPD